MVPRCGDKFLVMGEHLATFTGNSKTCRCGGDSYEVIYVDNTMLHQYLCAGMYRLTDDGWEIINVDRYISEMEKLLGVQKGNNDGNTKGRRETNIPQ